MEDTTTILKFEFNGEMARNFKTFLAASNWEYKAIEKGKDTYEFSVTVADAKDAWRLGNAGAKVFQK